MTYRVSGIQPVLDHAPGTEFDAEISEIQEARLIAAGALERVEEQAQAPKGSKVTDATTPDAPKA